MVRNRFATLLVAATALSIVGSPEALAQDAPRTELRALEEITVTAQRRAQSIQDVGISITAFSGDFLLASGIDDIPALEDFAPNFEVEEQFGNGVPSFSIRGVGFVDFFTNNAPTVGIYVDDVPYPLPIMTQGVMFDVERVEILRGPQGTLYGRNTTGGAVKVISARPTEEFAAGLSLEYGRFNLFEAEGYLSGGTDRIRARGAVRTSQGGGWQFSRETGGELGDQDRLAGRLTVEFDVTEDLMVTLRGNAFRDKSDNLGLQLFNPSPFGNAAVHQGRRSTSWGSSQEFADLVGIDTDTAPFRDNDGWGISGTVDWDLGFGQLVYIGAYNEIDRREFGDWDANELGAAAVFFTTQADVMSHELRLTGSADRLNYVLGALYGQEDLDELYQSDFVVSFGPGFAVSTPSTQEVETIGIYTHADYAVTDTITLVGGIRWEHEERDLIGLGTFATGFGPFNFANGTVDGTLENRDTDFSEVTGKAAIEYRPTEDYLLYASFSRGIKSGGFTTANTLNPAAVDPFTFEDLLAYEIGVKSDPLPGVLRVNAAAFYYDYNDQQVQSAIFDTALNTPVSRIVNAPEAEIYGFELDVILTVSDEITITQALGYKNGSYTEFNDLDLAASTAAAAPIFIDRSGQDIGIADVTYNGALIYQRPVFGRYLFTGQLDYQFRDNITRPLLGPVYEVEDYWVANAQIGIADADGRWELVFWGRNILNADYDETRNFFTPGADVAAPKQPATFGIRVGLTY